MTAARLRLEQVAPREYEALVPVLSEADEGDERILAQLRGPGRVSYRALLGEQLIGAATMVWQPSESELLYIVVLPDWRGHGHGKALVAGLLAEAARRRVASVCVGTANCSLDNIAFYQRCGFRMDRVRRDYFAYIQPPVVEHGITMRDMLVFTYPVPAEDPGR
jgi:ribosomal protein S18 acetylase RimI-like enzyme